MRLYFSSNLWVEQAQEYHKLVLNILCVTYFVTSTTTVFDAAILVREVCRMNS